MSRTLAARVGQISLMVTSRRYLTRSCSWRRTFAAEVIGLSAWRTRGYSYIIAARRLRPQLNSGALGAHFRTLVQKVDQHNEAYV
jgi:hypothetical protein